MRRPFGANFRPIDCGRWLAQADGANLKSPHGADFWLQYWCAAFGHFLSHPCANVVFVSYDKCCTNPAAALQSLGERIGRAGTAGFTSQAARFRTARHYTATAAAR